MERDQGVRIAFTPASVGMLFLRLSSSPTLLHCGGEGSSVFEEFGPPPLRSSERRGGREVRMVLRCGRCFQVRPLSGAAAPHLSIAIGEGSEGEDASGEGTGGPAWGARIIVLPMEEKIPRLHLTHQNFKKILYARSLRRKMTEAESILWNALRGRKLECKFRRQVPFGLYVADFCCMEHRFIIEVDGSIHSETGEYDVMREKMLSNGGFRIVRFRNEEIMKDVSRVLAQIRIHRG